MITTTIQVHASPLLVVEGLTRIHRKGNREVTALRDAYLEIREGEFVAITGPSGSGKSTLLSLLGLLDTPTSGEYQLLGKDVTTLKDQGVQQVADGCYQRQYNNPGGATLQFISYPVPENHLA